MKIKYIIIIGMIILTVIGGYCLVKLLNSEENIKEEDLDVKKIKSFYMTYSNGYAMNSYTRYRLFLKDEKYFVEIKPYDTPEEELLEKEVDIIVANKIIEILKKYKVNKWNGFDKTDQNVLDGDSFSLSIVLDEDKFISAHGYMMWPDNYRNVEVEISSVFMEIYNNEKGIKEDE